MKEQNWTVVRFPDGSWSFGGTPADPAYEFCERWRLPAKSGQHAVKLAQGRRQRGLSGRLLKIYSMLCPDDQLDEADPRREKILSEMREVVEAPSERDAARAIEWWNSWPNPHHECVLEFVQEARRKFREVQLPTRAKEKVA